MGPGLATSSASPFFESRNPPPPLPPGRHEDKLRCKNISVDHKPEDPHEKRRIKAAGGEVVFNGCYRVQHEHVRQSRTPIAGGWERVASGQTCRPGAGVSRTVEASSPSPSSSIIDNRSSMCLSCFRLPLTSMLPQFRGTTSSSGPRFCANVISEDCKCWYCLPARCLPLDAAPILTRFVFVLLCCVRTPGIVHLLMSTGLAFAVSFSC